MEDGSYTIGMARTMVITSGKGGVGKTTCCAGIGTALAARGKKTLLMEGDVGLNNLDAVLAVEDKILYEMSEVACGKISLFECIMPIRDNLFLLPSIGTSVALLTAEFFMETIEKLRTEFDYILIDSPAGLEEGFHRSVVGAQEAIIVTTPHVTSIRDGYKTSRVIAQYDMKRIELIVNRVRGEYVYKKESLSPEEIADMMQLPLCGVIPEENVINLGYAMERTVAAMSFSLIAAHIDGGERKIFDCTSSYKGWKNRLKRWLS